jgi:acyl-CoA thioesterase
MSLDDVLSPARDGDGWSLEVPDGWQQGRGAFGGLVLGAVTRALSGHAGGRPLRSLSGAIFAPVVPGAARITAELVHAGSAVSVLRATLEQGGKPAAHASAIFGAPRPGTPSWRRLAAPAAAPFETLPEVRLPSPPAPAFTRHFDMRVVSGFLFSGVPDAEVLGYVRPRVRPRVRDAALAVALADCYYPVLLAASAGPRPAATVSFQLELCAPPGDGDVFLHRGSSPSATEGYAVEDRELWTEDGRLVALNRQVFVVIK